MNVTDVCYTIGNTSDRNIPETHHDRSVMSWRSLKLSSKTKSLALNISQSSVQSCQSRGLHNNGLNQNIFVYFCEN